MADEEEGRQTMKSKRRTSDDSMDGRQTMGERRTADETMKGRWRTADNEWKSEGGETVEDGRTVSGGRDD